MYVLKVSADEIINNKSQYKVLVVNNIRR